MPKIYANENFPQQTAEVLRKLGHDVLTTLEAGNANQAIPDAEVLNFATADKRVLVTFNRKHFIKLHQENDAHTGIIVCTVDSDFAALAQRIHTVLESNPDMAGKLVRVNRPNP